MKTQTVCMIRQLLFFSVILLCGTAMAQQSASFRLTEYTFNAGGHPLDGAQPSSAAFRITLDAIGTPVGAVSPSSASFRTSSGFLSAYLPPFELSGLVFTDHQTLRWNAEANSLSYNLYRDSLGMLSGMGFGDCHESDLASTTATDGDPVPAGGGFFYLVTGRNRVQEDGSKGLGSDGTEREGNVCP